MTGTITKLYTDGVGAIASDAFRRPWSLPFHRTDVRDNGFDRLTIGQRVRFDQEADPRNPSRQHAVDVAPVPAAVA